MAWGGSFVFSREKGQAEQHGSFPKKDDGGSFVFNREAAAKQQQLQQPQLETSEMKEETKGGAESPKLWVPATAQQSDPPPLGGDTKPDLYKLYETMGSNVTEMSLKDIVDRPKKPVRKSPFKSSLDRNTTQGGTAAASAGVGAGAGGRKTNNHRHHRSDISSKTKVIAPPKFNGKRIPENAPLGRSFGEFLQEEDLKSAAFGQDSEDLPRSRSAHVPETSPRRSFKAVSPKIVIPESVAQPPKSPKARTKSPKGASINPLSGNHAPPSRSPRRSPGPSPLSSPRPRRASPLASASSPARMGYDREPSRSVDGRATSGGPRTGGVSPLASATPRRSSVDYPRSPLVPISSPARLGYEREPWSIDGVAPGAASPMATPRRSSVGQKGSPLAAISSPVARLGYEREPWSFEEMRKAQSPRRSTSTASRRDANKSPARPVRASYNKGSKDDNDDDNNKSDKSSLSLGDILGKIISAPQFREAPRANHCSNCSSYTLMKTRCLVCGKIYCRNCVKEAMGDMPEGRKCTKTCVGRPIHSKYENEAGRGCFWIPKASKITEMRQKTSNSTPTFTRSNNSTPGPPDQSNKTHANLSNRTQNQNIPPRMSVSSNS